jgi:capsular exopolysaccharide synthesis family protein
MAVKGKLEKALDKAKSQRQGQPNSAAVGRNKSTQSKSTHVVADAQRSLLGATFRPPELHLDLERCVANRILVSGRKGRTNATAEASFRMLRTRILQRTQANNWNVLGLTSPGAGDGKSVTGLNLALTIARQRDRHVFLIDLDMRDPSICEYLGVTPPVEINDFLKGDARVNEVFFSVGIKNFTLAGTRTFDDHSSEILATGKIEELFEYVRQLSEQALVIVDLPPLLTADDALVMAPQVDATLLVLAEGKTRRDSTAKALELLEDYEIAGIILNRSKTVVRDSYST